MMSCALFLSARCHGALGQERRRQASEGLCRVHWVESGVADPADRHDPIA
jgi:hypothetical protein